MNLWPVDASKAAQVIAIPAHAVRTVVRVLVPATVQVRHAEACARGTVIRDAIQAVATDVPIHVRRCVSTAVPIRNPQDRTDLSEAPATFPHVQDAHRTAVHRAAALHAPFRALVHVSIQRVPDRVSI